MSFRSRVISVFERLADRLDTIDAKLDKIGTDVHDLKTKVLLVTSDHDGELIQLNERVRDLEKAKRSNGADGDAA